MTRVIVGPALGFEVLPHPSDSERAQAAVRRLTEFLWQEPSSAVDAMGGTIMVADKRTNLEAPTPGAWKPLMVHDGPNEFWVSPEARTAVALFDDLDKLEGRQIAKPFRWVFSILLDQHGIMLPHATALTLAFQEKAILLVGPSGSGKSSVAGAWLRQELPVIGDDRVPVWKAEGTFRGGTFRAGGLYRSFCLDEARAHVLGIPGATEHRQNGKVVHKLSRAIMRADGSEIAAVVSVRVDRDEGMRLRDLSPGDALFRLAPSSLIPSIGVSRSVLHELGGLVSSVPCYELTVGTQLTRTPALLASLFR